MENKFKSLEEIENNKIENTSSIQHPNYNVTLPSGNVQIFLGLIIDQI